MGVVTETTRGTYQVPIVAVSAYMGVVTLESMNYITGKKLQSPPTWEL